MAFGESACRHVLAIFKGAGVTIDASVENLARDWVRQAGPNGYVIVVLPAGEGSANLPPSLQRYHRLNHPAPEFELGTSIIRAAGLGLRQKLFLSYRRQDSKDLADQIHEALGRRGFQIYLDRFSWTPGRLFPQEIAEELAERGTMLLVESAGLHLSRWTQWELSFARMYHLGILALNVDAAPHERGIDASDRHLVSSNSVGQLDRPQLDNAVNFIVRRYNIAEMRRRIYYEALVRRAALDAGGAITPRPDGLLEVSGKGHSAIVLASGRPASLIELSLLGRVSATFRPTSPIGILVGQHEHLPPDTRPEVAWLAERVGIALTPTMSIFRSVRRLIQSGRP
jgi:hypothetical protein